MKKIVPLIAALVGLNACAPKVYTLKDDYNTINQYEIKLKKLDRENKKIEREMGETEKEIGEIERKIGETEREKIRLEEEIKKLGKEDTYKLKITP